MAQNGEYVVSMESAICGDSRIAYRVFGNGPADVVIVTALASVQAEWWPFCERISSRVSVLTYDRAGYGLSTKGKRERSPRNGAGELAELLSVVQHRRKVILVGHSQGGLYCVQYAMAYPDQVAALILLDPLTPHDDRFRELLAPREYQQSGADKSRNLVWGRILTSLGLGFALKPLLRKALPFYYYPDYSEEAANYI